MAIQLNEEIRDEARKMSEYVVEDTKRTVEMMEWIKSKRSSDNVLVDVIKEGAEIATNNILNGANVITSQILPRLRDRLATQFINDESFAKAKTAKEQIIKANDKITEIRNYLTANKLDASDLDDICYDVQVILSDYLKTL